MPTGTPPEGRFNQLTAYALLSRVYMHQSDFDNALDMAGNVIASGQFQLNDDVITFWRDEFSREGIWEIAHTLTRNFNVFQELTKTKSKKKPPRLLGAALIKAIIT